MATDIRPPAYIPQGTFSGYITPQKNIERRQRLADVLAMQGMDTSPVQSPWQALARVAQAGAGAYGNYQAGQMEQQRFKAMGEAMRGGMTPEQMFGTGDPQMMQLGEFMIEQKRLQMQQDQQNMMFQQMAHQNKVTDTQLARGAPGLQEAAVLDSKMQAERKLKAEAATRFMDKLKGIYGRMGITFDPKTQAPDFSKARSDLFGQYQGGPINSILSNAASAVGASNAEAERQQLETDIQTAAQDYAGALGIDPQLARRYLPALTSPDVRTAYGGLQSAAANAQRYIDEAGGGVAPGPVTVNPLPPPAPGPGPANHPLTPRPQLNARAGEVPLPAPQANSEGPLPGGGMPFPTDPGSKAKGLTPEMWARMPLAHQLDWMREVPQ